MFKSNSDGAGYANGFFIYFAWKYCTRTLNKKKTTKKIIQCFQNWYFSGKFSVLFFFCVANFSSKSGKARVHIYIYKHTQSVIVLLGDGNSDGQNFPISK